MSLRSPSPPSASTWRFVGHYVEMVAVMFVGMIVVAVPAAGVLSAMGTSISELERDAPAAALLGMGVAMTVPMVAWMGFRGHSAQPCAEMAAAMIVPTLAVVGLLAAALVEDYEALLLLEHVAMLPSMLAVMLLRRQDYSHHPQRRQELAA
jgi:hypothetical protein